MGTIPAAYQRKELRKLFPGKHEMSQTEVAKILSVRASIARWERHKRDLSDAMAVLMQQVSADDDKVKH